MCHEPVVLADRDIQREELAEGAVAADAQCGTSYREERGTDEEGRGSRRDAAQVCRAGKEHRDESLCEGAGWVLGAERAREFEECACEHDDLVNSFVSGVVRGRTCSSPFRWME